MSLPKDGVNPYENHPGFEASGYHLRYTVTQRSPWGGITSGGFGCEANGGHCLPGEQCDKRRKRFPESLMNGAEQ